MLSDRSIQKMIGTGDIRINGTTPDDHQFQPVSIDLRLGDIRDSDGYLHLTPDDEAYNPGFPYMMQPGEFMLGSTIEEIQLSCQLVGQVHGKSTLARKGLLVHAAGLVDPGFRGQLTLEMLNMSGEPIALKRGMLICQITFEFLSCTPERAYGDDGLRSRYQGQWGPTPAWEV